MDNYKLGYYFLNSCLQHYLNCSGTKAIELKNKDYQPFNSNGIDKRVDYAGVILKIAIRSIHALNDPYKNILLLEYAEQVRLKDLPVRIGKSRSRMYDYRKQAITLFADIFLPEFKKIKRDFWFKGDAWWLKIK